MATTIFVQQVLHIFKEFQVSSLVGSDGDPLDIFLDGAFHYFRHRPVMSQVNDLSPLRLQEATHDIDRGIMTIEERSGRNEPHFMYRGITHNRMFGKQANLAQKTNDC